jgi:hypothetical protein
MYQTHFQIMKREPKVFPARADMKHMEDLDFIVETVFGDLPEAERKVHREQMLHYENPEWTKKFAKRLRRVFSEGERDKR